ncbi:cholesterol oxidase domain protein [Rhodococcus sp. MTM3W5.2]|nr:cholesterol oxidase domain protein [Rhodococcus sp. MTM3W5.2]
MLDSVWTCHPKSPDDVVRLANWAHDNGYKIRPRGAMHGWTPLTVVNGAPVDKVILVDTMKHLNGVSVNAGGSPATVTAGPGATLDAITTALQAQGLGFANLPAPGVLSIAGSLAVDAHGAALPANGQATTPGHTYGSLSNLVTSLTAVVWDGSKYAQKTYSRNDPQIKPLLTNLGRTFLTSVTLQAGPNFRMRCQSYTDIKWTEMFGAKGASGRTFESYVASNGGVEAIWYPFTEKPWLKVWSVAPTKPAGSREVTGPYNYPFSDNLPEAVTDLLGQMNSGLPGIAPAFGNIMYTTTVAGLAATGANDIWGWSKDIQFYIKATTLRLTEGGGAVITNRANIGQVIHDFTHWFNERIEFYKAKGQYPLNGPVEIRCCGLDQAADVKVPRQALRPSPRCVLARTTRVGHRHLAERARRPGYPRHVRVLPRDGAVDALALHGQRLHLPPRVVEGLGVRRGPVHRRRDHQRRPAAELPRRRARERQLGHRTGGVQHARPAPDLQQLLHGSAAAVAARPVRGRARRSRARPLSVSRPRIGREHQRIHGQAGDRPTSGSQAISKGSRNTDTAATAVTTATASTSPASANAVPGVWAAWAASTNTVAPTPARPACTGVGSPRANASSAPCTAQITATRLHRAASTPAAESPAAISACACACGTTAALIDQPAPRAITLDPASPVIAAPPACPDGRSRPARGRETNPPASRRYRSRGRRDPDTCSGVRAATSWRRSDRARPRTAGPRARPPRPRCGPACGGR